MTHIAAVTFTTAVAPFPKNKRIRLEPGLNVVVGDQGTGKSTLLEVLAAELSDATWFRTHRLVDSRGRRTHLVTLDGTVAGPVIAHNSETDNARTKSHFDGDTDDMVFQIMARRASHGAAQIAQINRLVTAVRDADTPGLLLLDEPEAGLAPHNVATLAAALTRPDTFAGWQLVVATHHPWIIEAATKVISLDDGGRHLRPTTYLDRARQPTTPPTSAASRPA